MASAESTSTTTVVESTTSQPVSTLPSGQPIDSSAAADASAKKPLPSVRSTLAAAPSTIDALIARLHRCVQTRAGNDTVLLFLTYFTRLTGASLEALSRSSLRASARELVAIAVKLPPSASVAVAQVSPVSPAAAVALRLAARFNALSSLLSEVRTFGRLWGLLGLYFVGKKTLATVSSPSAGAGTSGEKDGEAASSSRRSLLEARFDKLVALLQLVALVSYQASENAAYLTSKKVLPLHPTTAARLGLWSVRSWMAYIGIELGRLLVQRQRRVAAAPGGRLTAARDGKWSADWSRDFFRTLAWAPLTYQWSTPNPPLSDLSVALLAFYPSCGAMKDLWLSTA
jgi:hypothetical protein